jgi:hypothetical protein
MMAADDKLVAITRRELMKKLIPLMLGLVLAFGSVAVTFAAADDTKTDSTAKKKKKKKSSSTAPPTKGSQR